MHFFSADWLTTTTSLDDDEDVLMSWNLQSEGVLVYEIRKVGGQKIRRTVLSNCYPQRAVGTRSAYQAIAPPSIRRIGNSKSTTVSDTDTKLDKISAQLDQLMFAVCLARSC